MTNRIIASDSIRFNHRAFGKRPVLIVLISIGIQSMMRPQSRSSCKQEILLVLGWYYQEMHLGVARFAREHRWHVTFDFDEPIPQAWNGQGVLTLLGAGNDYW